MLTAGTLLLASITVTAMLTGLIWTIQVVHYPLFGWVGHSQFNHYHSLHGTRIGVIVVPLMLVEAVCSIMLVMVLPSGAAQSLAVVGLYLVAVIWLSTSLLQVPYHRALSRRFSKRTLRRLVASNWIRTGAWTLRSALLVTMLVEVMSFRADATESVVLAGPEFGSPASSVEASFVHGPRKGTASLEWENTGRDL